jgi:uncharacterized protein YecT (DUF1311 family)
MKAAILFLLVLSVSSSAQKEETCPGTTYDTSMCSLRILGKVEIQLNSTYQAALMAATQNYTARDVQNLRVAERRWISYRDAACDAEYGLWGGGSGGSGRAQRMPHQDLHTADHRPSRSLPSGIQEIAGCSATQV